MPTVWSTAACGWCPSGSGSGAPPNTTNAIWYPSGVDTTLQAGGHWFFTPGDEASTVFFRDYSPLYFAEVRSS